VARGPKLEIGYPGSARDVPGGTDDVMGDSDAKSWMSCLGWGCLAVVVLAVLGIGSCVAVVYRGGSAAHEVADAYLQAVADGRFEDAFATLGPGITADRDLRAFVSFERANRDRHGECGDWRLTGTSLNRQDGRTQADLSYLADCEHGPVEVRFAVEKVDREWLIQDINYRTPGAPESVPVCPECGAVLPPGARFCPSCGAAIDSAEGAPSGNATPVEGDR